MDNFSKWNKAVIAKVLALFVIILCVYFVVLIINDWKSGEYIGSGVTATNTITVSGTGDVLAVPDVATFSFTVSKEDKVISAAQDFVASTTNNILASLKNDFKISDNDIQTESYDINPVYDYVNYTCVANVPCRQGNQVLRDYQVSQTVSVKIRDTSKSGDILGMVGGSGATDVTNLVFSIDKPDDLNNQARSKAIAQAQGKAEELAKELGVSLIRVVGFNEEGENPYPVYAKSAVTMEMGGGAAVPAPEIPTGENKITSNVSVTYEIK